MPGRNLQSSFCNLPFFRSSHDSCFRLRRARPPTPRSRRSPSNVVSPARPTCRSRSSSAASATPTCTRSRSEWPGTVYPVRPGPRDRRPGHDGRQRASRSSRRATSRRSAAWSTRAATARAATRASSSTARRAWRCTYNSPDTHIAGAMTYGGYSTQIVVDEHFVLRVPPTLDPAAAAPLLCAGITTYSPLRHWDVGPGQEGRHRRPRRARPHGREVRRTRSGAHTVLFTTSPGKAADAKRLGADEVVVSKDADADGSSTRAASTSSSTRSPRRTTSTPSSTLLQARRHDVPGRRAGRSRTRRQASSTSIFKRRAHRRLADRRHPRDAGDARLLRRARHRLATSR